ncbi:unnamed protein product [Acanthoscelides obtectus]|uniref:Uncharacterized protein n=1 Tax=Acanthoscelides obtectus TaxID=200917 RepID=A0A9P0PI56_ACAOB|nr:unnamed protein product [Acanthoscelides obtectus]CAK1659816.1 hypothetical protein AOBTE_LOCUS21688 [Acanthoscelides obtectus]
MSTYFSFRVQILIYKKSSSPRAKNITLFLRQSCHK